MALERGVLFGLHVDLGGLSGEIMCSTVVQSVCQGSLVPALKPILQTCARIASHQRTDGVAWNHFLGEGESAVPHCRFEVDQELAITYGKVREHFSEAVKVEAARGGLSGAMAPQAASSTFLLIWLLGAMAL